MAHQGHDVYIYSFTQAGHIQTNFATLSAAKEVDAQNNENNFIELQNWIRKVQPQVVINQMPYLHSIGKVLTVAQNTNPFLLLGCLRNTLYSVKLNLPAYIRNTAPKALFPLLNNPLGRALMLLFHKRRHARDLKRILDTYDFFVMFGPPNLKELSYFVGNYKREKTALIPNSIPRVEPRVPPKEKRILWLSRLSYGQKRADLILPFWERLHAIVPEWQLDIVGDGDAYEDIAKEIQALQLPRVKLYGKQKPDAYYRRASIYIMTSAYEGFPNTLLEAMSYGCAPVVYDNYPIVQWVIESGTTGHLIPPFEVNKMVSTVQELVSRDSDRKSMQNAALRRAEDFTIDKVGRQWLEFIEKQGIQ